MTRVPSIAINRPWPVLRRRPQPPTDSPAAAHDEADKAVALLRREARAAALRDAAYVALVRDGGLR